MHTSKKLDSLSDGEPKPSARIKSSEITLGRIPTTSTVQVGVRLKLGIGVGMGVKHGRLVHGDDACYWGARG